MHNSLEEKLKQIDKFFDNLSIEEFEKMSFDAGLGEIEDETESSFMFSIGAEFDTMYSKDKSIKLSTQDNDFYYVDDEKIKGAA